MLGSKTIPSCSLQNTGMTQIASPPKITFTIREPYFLAWLIIFNSSQVRCWGNTPISGRLPIQGVLYRFNMSVLGIESDHGYFFAARSRIAAISPLSSS